MIVVCDTSPINYLVQMALVELLPDFYGTIYLPETVARELEHRGAPDAVRRWIEDRPAWLKVVGLKAGLQPKLPLLDPGERDAIALAMQLPADTLLADDRRAREAAANLGFRVTGTLGLLFDADRAGKINFDEAVAQLLRLGFRASRDSIEQVRAGSR